MSRESPIEITDDSVEQTAPLSSDASSSSSSSASSSSSSSSDSSSASAVAPAKKRTSAVWLSAKPSKNAPPKEVVAKVSPSTLATTTNGPKRILNPYLQQKKKNFVGGAEAARQAARKKARTGSKILTPIERQRLDEVLPLRMNPMERFCASLLRSAASEYVAAENSTSPQSLALWKTICGRVGLTPPETPLAPCFNQAEPHFSLRAALVLEEARQALAQNLAAKWKKGSRGDTPAMTLIAHYVETNQSNGHTKVVFRKDSPFHRDELFHLRSGTVLECLIRNGPRTLQGVHLAVIFSSNREQMEAKREFTATFFRQIPADLKHAKLMVRPLETLVTQLRSFAAMPLAPHRIAFLHNLLGNKAATHTRFADDGNVTNKSISDFFQSAPKEPTTLDMESSIFRLPKLNPTQNKAATLFLESKSNTITLVQGPPGTGKTTLLVSLIARYLMEHGDSKRILVCAPTNKAISVLATRFMECFDESKANFTPIMVGDADKLLGDEKSNTSNKLRGILCYSWLQTLLEEYRSIRDYFAPASRRRENYKPDDLYKWALRLEKRIENGLYGLAEEFFEQAGKVSNGLNVILGGSGYDIFPVVSQMVKKLEELQKTQQDSVWRLLIANANIIFCTLASSGGMILKNAPKIDDLVVDEAAAATEPELCIPFHLQPKRLLCVGDPLQLPATVLSRRAIELGLSQSLHERLMYHCDFDHVMLDVQYRMNPEISRFPSQKFYNSKIQNGSNVAEVDYRKPPFVLDGRPYIFVNTVGGEEQGAGGSYRNHAEAKTIVHLVEQLRDRALACNNPGPWYSTDRIRIITFYQGQVGLLKRLLRDRGFGDKVVVATVDSSQGCEADVVLVSFVRSPHRDGLGARGAAGFLTDDRRMNVALTRARYQLVCVGNVNGLASISGADTINSLAKTAQERQVVRLLNDG